MNICGVLYFRVQTEGKNDNFSDMGQRSWQNAQFLSNDLLGIFIWNVKLFFTIENEICVSNEN